MDDFFKSVESVRKALELHSQLVKLMELGHFHLTKWLSNAKEVIEQIPEAERAPSIKVVDDEIIMPVERALGIVWNTKSDCLVYSVQRRPLTDTRRKILSLIASLFDPLGFLAPFLVKAKMFLQKIWQLGIGWDDPLPQAFMKEWSQWQNDLENISEFAVPRFYRHIAEKPMKIQLHVFGDASERAFGSVAYFRFTYASGSVRCAFVTAKTRVAPQKRLSIPKLELQAAVLSVRMSDMVTREHDYVIDDVYFWSDSIVVLYWIHGASKRQPPFIANRIGEILDSTDPSQWQHCPGKLNPADDSSRGLSAAEITSNNRWMNGPAYLLLSEEMWPKKDLNLDALKVNGDGTTEDNDPTDLWTCVATQDTPSFVQLAKYSKLTKLLRV